MAASPGTTYESHNEDDTAAIARRLAGQLRGGEYISLEGDLGAGKTLFTRALAAALGIGGPITSPTFVIQKTYPVPSGCPSITHLAHYDFYRITNYHELLDLGFEDHDSHSIVLAEWGNLFINDFPRPPIRIIFHISPGDHRKIEILNEPAT